MTKLKLDERIINILTCMLNAAHNHTTISIRFDKGKQKVSSLYTSPSPGDGTHFIDFGEQPPLDDVLSIAQSFKVMGDVKSCIKGVEEEKREVLKRLNECKKHAKDLDITLTNLLELKGVNND